MPILPLRNGSQLSSVAHKAMPVVTTLVSAAALSACESSATLYQTAPSAFAMGIFTASGVTALAVKRELGEEIFLTTAGLGAVVLATSGIPSLFSGDLDAAGFQFIMSSLMYAGGIVGGKLVRNLHMYGANLFSKNKEAARISSFANSSALEIAETNDKFKQAIQDISTALQALPWLQEALDLTNKPGSKLREYFNSISVFTGKLPPKVAEDACYMQFADPCQLVYGKDASVSQIRRELMLGIFHACVSSKITPELAKYILAENSTLEKLLDPQIRRIKTRLKKALTVEDGNLLMHKSAQELTATLILRDALKNRAASVEAMLVAMEKEIGSPSQRKLKWLVNEVGMRIQGVINFIPAKLLGFAKDNHRLARVYGRYAGATSKLVKIESLLTSLGAPDYLLSGDHESNLPNNKPTTSE